MRSIFVCVGMWARLPVCVRVCVSLVVCQCVWLFVGVVGGMLVALFVACCLLFCPCVVAFAHLGVVAAGCLTSIGPSL